MRFLRTLRELKGESMRKAGQQHRTSRQNKGPNPPSLSSDEPPPSQVVGISRNTRSI